MALLIPLSDRHFRPLPYVFNSVPSSFHVLLSVPPSYFLLPLPILALASLTTLVLLYPTSIHHSSFIETIFFHCLYPFPFYLPAWSRFPPPTLFLIVSPPPRALLFDSLIPLLFSRRVHVVVAG